MQPRTAMLRKKYCDRGVQAMLNLTNVVTVTQLEIEGITASQDYRYLHAENC